jgi:cyclopropane fatty-acyl-phospholipid synthase-like methyltransferase
MSGWGAELAVYWRNYVPPCRPSRFELNRLSDIAKDLKLNVKSRRLRVLILGSTTEFRDWAFEERLEAVVVDSSLEFHREVSKELTHENVNESVIFDDWRSMKFDQEFDLVVGDLVVGNVPRVDLPRFLENVHSSLLPHGRFVTKSFFARDDRSAKSVDEIIEIMQQFDPCDDPFPDLIYELAMACTDHDKGILSFERMFNEIERAWQQGRITDDQLNRFTEFGWGSKMKFDFLIPTKSEWSNQFLRFFDLEVLHRDEDSFLSSFPLYVLKPRQDFCITTTERI